MVRKKKEKKTHNGPQNTTEKNNKNHTKNYGWIWLLHEGKQFLLHISSILKFVWVCTSKSNEQMMLDVLVIILEGTFYYIKIQEAVVIIW